MMQENQCNQAELQGTEVQEQNNDGEVCLEYDVTKEQSSVEKTKTAGKEPTLRVKIKNTFLFQ